MIFVDCGEEDVDGGVIDVSRNSRHSVAAVGTGHGDNYVEDYDDLHLNPKP